MNILIHSVDTVIYGTQYPKKECKMENTNYTTT